MKFKKLTVKTLVEEIRAINGDTTCLWMPFTVFYGIYPNQNKVMNLKNIYKPDTNVPGLYSELQDHQNADNELKERAAEKMQQNTFIGMHYDNNEASLKLHLNLNEIGEIDESVILGLVKLLIEESESEDNNMSFHFKIIDPAKHGHERFKNTDQLTIYFDKYSSAADMIRLANKIETYLLESGIPENTTTLGPKESFGFNSFVSARFDTNKLLKLYDVHSFFDLELKKFFHNHNVKELADVPLCVFEVIFNTLITSEQIQNLKSESSDGLSDEDSLIVQNEFTKAVQDPVAYLNQYLPDPELKKRQEQAKLKINALIEMVKKLKFDFSQCSSREAVEKYLMEINEIINMIAYEAETLKKEFSKFDTATFKEFGWLLHQKKMNCERAAELQLKKLSENEQKELALACENPDASLKADKPNPELQAALDEAKLKINALTNTVKEQPIPVPKISSKPQTTTGSLYSNHAPNSHKNTGKKTNHPSSYTRMWDKYQAGSSEASSKELRDYYSALAILQDYCKTPSYNTFSFLSNMELAFTRHWNRHHIGTVRNLVLSLPHPNFKPKDEDMTVSHLLNRLKDELIKKGNRVNPDGSLARRIDFIQTQANFRIIDIRNLNREICGFEFLRGLDFDV